MWKHRSDILTPLTKMTSKQATWNWTEEHQKAFEHMKKSISRETLLVYPNFSKPFVIHMDASKVQLGAVISQDNNPIGFQINPVTSRIETNTQMVSAIRAATSNTTYTNYTYNQSRVGFVSLRHVIGELTNEA